MSRLVAVCSDPQKPDLFAEFAIQRIIAKGGRAERLTAPISKRDAVAGGAIIVVTDDYLKRELPSFRQLRERREQADDHDVAILPYRIDGAPDASPIEGTIGDNPRLLVDGLTKLTDCARDMVHGQKAAPIEPVDDWLDIVTGEQDPIVVQAHLLLLEIAGRRALALPTRPHPAQRLPNLAHLEPTMGRASEQVFRLGQDLLERSRSYDEQSRERLVQRYLAALFFLGREEHRFFGELIAEAAINGRTNVEILEAICSSLEPRQHPRTQPGFTLDMALDERDFRRIGRRWFDRIVSNDRGLVERHLGDIIWIDPYTGRHEFGRLDETGRDLARWICKDDGLDVEQNIDAVVDRAQKLYRRKIEVIPARAVRISVPGASPGLVASRRDAAGEALVARDEARQPVAEHRQARVRSSGERSLPPTGRSEHVAWLDEVYAFVENDDEERAIDSVFDTMDDLLLAGDLRRCDEILHAVDVERLTATLMLAFLSITLAAKQRLHGRHILLGRIEARLRVLAPDRIEELLAGLR